ncbi:MEST (predicted), partial [Pycnogonum litorale]
MIPKLKDKFKSVVLLDFIGFGFSDKPRDFEYSIKAQADIVQSLLSRLNCRSVHVISHDYGDTVAQELLARQIEDKSSQPKIKSLCLLNGGIFPETNKPFLFQK